MKTLLWFFPQELIVLLIVGAALCLILGLRKVAGSLFMAGILMTIVPPFLEPLLSSLPWWVLVLGAGFFLLAMFRQISSLLLGRSAANHMVGVLAADLVKALIFFPATVLRWVIRLIS